MSKKKKISFIFYKPIFRVGKVSWAVTLPRDDLIPAGFEVGDTVKITVELQRKKK